MPPRCEMRIADTVTKAAMAGTRMCESPQKSATVAKAKGRAPAKAMAHSRRRIQTDPVGRGMLIGLRAGGPDHASVLLGFAANVARELRGRAADGLGAELHHLL